MSDGEMNSVTPSWSTDPRLILAPTHTLQNGEKGSRMLHENSASQNARLWAGNAFELRDKR